MNEINEAISYESNVNSEEVKTIELSDGSSVELSSTDEPDNSNSTNLQSNYGLKMRYADVGGTNGTVWSSVDASCEVTDSKAEKVGYDMNALGTYKLNGKLNNGYIVLTSYIKLTSLNKSSKVARVYPKYTYRD
ncbi:hypothetical protein [Peribacillus simplex]|uniref:hypothetical protein n=1 Tax=Peribacillus simplex TaxID=1478 RepID=UPI003D2C52E7